MKLSPDTRTVLLLLGLVVSITLLLCLSGLPAAYAKYAEGYYTTKVGY